MLLFNRGNIIGAPGTGPVQRWYKYNGRLNYITGSQTSTISSYQPTYPLTTLTPMAKPVLQKNLHYFKKFPPSFVAWVSVYSACNNRGGGVECSTLSLPTLTMYFLDHQIFLQILKTWINLNTQNFRNLSVTVTKVARHVARGPPPRQERVRGYGGNIFSLRKDRTST